MSYDPDEFRSRKSAGDLKDIAHAERSIREFKARVLIRKIDLACDSPCKCHGQFDCATQCNCCRKTSIEDQL